MALLKRILVVSIVLLIGILIAIKLIYGGGRTDFPNRSTPPLYAENQLEVVGNLPTPGGNIAVSSTGRVFVSMHPEAKPNLTLVELVNGQPVPWPDLDHQKTFGRVLGIRIDQQNRLWALDTGNHGLNVPKVTAWDLKNGKLLREIKFDRSIAGLGSDYNDLQVSPDGETLYIVDSSFFRHKPAIIVVDLKTGSSRRVLDNHPSVKPDRYIPIVRDRKMEIYGLVALRPGVDSVALSRDGKWLYYSPITSEHLYRISTDALKNSSLSDVQLADLVETLPVKTMSDGISIDDQNRVYIADPEHSALHRYMPETGKIETLVQSDQLRFPDGLSFGPDGWIYMTASALDQVLGKPKKNIAENAPYQVFRLRTDATAVAGQ